MKTSPTPTPTVFATDFGGPISDNTRLKKTDPRHLYYPDPHSTLYRQVPIIEGAYDVMKAMSRNGSVKVVCKIDFAELHFLRVRDILRINGFGELLDVDKDVYFCPGFEDKAPICEKLGAYSNFDDLLKVLCHMVDKVPVLGQFRPWCPSDEPYRHLVASGKIKVAHTWHELGSLIGV